MIEDIIRLTKNGFKILSELGVHQLFKGLISYLRELFLIPFAIYKIKNNRNYKLEYLMKFVFFDVFELIKPYQIYSEFYELLLKLMKRKPKNLLEIGTARGGSLYLFSKVADHNALIISIDLPGGPFGGGYPSWKLPLYKSFASEKQTLHLLRMDSHKKETKDKVKLLLKDEAFDFIFIDGDHSYDGVKKDFEMYSKLIKKNGMIAFHDIVPGPEGAVGGAFEFWKEIKTKYKSKEIIDTSKQLEAGIGILYL